MGGGARPGLEMRRDDVPDAPEQVAGKTMTAFAAILGGTHSYTLHWNGKIPKDFFVMGEGVVR